MKLSFRNKRASFEYFLFDEYVAGLQLTGTEIKSIRDGKVNIADAFCSFLGDELFVRNMHIAEYTHGTYNNHDTKRDRKLLLNRRELKKLIGKLNEKGFTIIPTELFINEKGHAKLRICLARGKKFFDKRDTIRKKDVQRDLDREKD